MRWDRRLALGLAVAGVLLFLTTLSFVVADGGLSQRTAFLLFAGLALVVVYALVDQGAITAFRRDRRSRAGSFSLLTCAAVAGLLVAANVIASRSTAAGDMTQSGIHTLSPRSAAIARQLGADLTVTGFFRSDDQATRRDVQSLLNLYQQQSPRVKVRFVDPSQAAALALGLGVRSSGSIVLQYRGKPPVVLDPAQQTESDVTGAMLRLESTRSPSVCWATGDGERSLDDAGEIGGYSAVADLLRTTSYRAQKVPLAQQGVPATCDALVVLQLSRPLSEASVRAIQDYLGRGGKLLLAIDPWVDPAIVASANAVVQRYGGGFDGGLVIEPDAAHAAAGDSTIPLVSHYGASPITRSLEGRYVFFPQATPVTGSGGAASSIDLASTTDRAYVISQERTALERRAADRPGPFVLMRSLEAQSPGGTTRIVLSGTSALAENRTLPPSALSSNPDLLLASLDWLTQQDALVAIGNRAPLAEPLALGDQDLWLSRVLTVVVLPLLALVAWLIVRARRLRPI